MRTTVIGLLIGVVIGNAGFFQQSRNKSQVMDRTGKAGIPIWRVLAAEDLVQAKAQEIPGRKNGRTGNATTIDIRGIIKTIHIANGAALANGILGTVLVEGQLEADTHFDKASIRVTKQTRIENRGHTGASFQDLHVADRVEVLFTGKVSESYPVQATASSITIIN